MLEKDRVQRVNDSRVQGKSKKKKAEKAWAMLLKVQKK